MRRPVKKQSEVRPLRCAVVYGFTLVLLVDFGVTLLHGKSPLRLLHTYTASVLVGGMLIWSADLALSALDSAVQSRGAKVLSSVFVLILLGVSWWIFTGLSAQHQEWKQQVQALLKSDVQTGIDRVDWQVSDYSKLLPCELVVWHITDLSGGFYGKAVCPASNVSLALYVSSYAEGERHRWVRLQRK